MQEIIYQNQRENGKFFVLVTRKTENLGIFTVNVVDTGEPLMQLQVGFPSTGPTDEDIESWERYATNAISGYNYRIERERELGN